MGTIEGVQPRPGAVRVLDADADLTLARDDAVVSVASSDSSTVAATMTATQAGHVVAVVLRSLTASTTGKYTLDAGDGTITLDAAGEGCLLAYDGSDWQLAALTGGATFA